jgi:hypothetical protein
MGQHSLCWDDVDEGVQLPYFTCDLSLLRLGRIRIWGVDCPNPTNPGRAALLWAIAPSETLMLPNDTGSYPGKHSSEATPYQNGRLSPL